MEITDASDECGHVLDVIGETVLANRAFFETVLSASSRRAMYSWRTCRARARRSPEVDPTSSSGCKVFVLNVLSQTRIITELAGFDTFVVLPLINEHWVVIENITAAIQTLCTHTLEYVPKGRNLRSYHQYIVIYSVSKNRSGRSRESRIALPVTPRLIPMSPTTTASATLT
jgi:hypothetical protein